MKLSKIDKVILESYKNLIYGLGDYLGEESEVVLHSLENYDTSVIAIVGKLTNRKEGAPITDLALKMLQKIESSPSSPAYLTYFTKSKNGNKMKSSTIAIHGENNRIIGLVCINLNLECTLDSFLREFIYKVDSYSVEQKKINNRKEERKENFSSSITEVIDEAVEKYKEIVFSDDSIAYNNKNKEIIKRLYDEGIFNIKEAVIKVSENLMISKNTVYLHLRNLKKNK